MAHGAKGPSTSTMPPNGTAAHEPSSSAVNRKKQKRREKEAARKAAQNAPVPVAGKKDAVGHPPSLASSGAQPRQPTPQYADAELDEPPYDDDAEFYSDEEIEHYESAHGSNGHYQQPYGHPPMPSGNSKKSRKKKKGSSAPAPLAYTQNSEPGHASLGPYQVRRSSDGRLFGPPYSTARSGSKQDAIWNNSNMEERERIREFWLSLGEDERKSLVKIEKEAVLRKMKEQQKHSCSCTVCGRKRTAIEEELEVLYDAYYEELEHAPQPRQILHNHPPGHFDDEDDDEYSGDEDEDYSNSEISSEGDYSSEERSLPPPEATDFLKFGSSLTVKGGILTVADDLLKNDGKKFIEMMEQLAERRMQREEEAQFQTHPSMYRSHSGHNHDASPEEDDYDDEGEDEEGYEDEDYEEEDEDEDDAMTEEQRMEEGRRMFQIFAARMFEQRVLQAYREKIAAERQQQLLKELEEEDVRKDQKEAKKAKEAQKRKEKKDKQRQLKAEKEARRDAEIAAKEAEAKAAEEKRLEEQRRKREEQRKKKEAERKAQEEEKQRKEAERLKRQQEERERQQEAERKAREQKALEKRNKDEAKRKEREERETKEREAREKKAKEEKERKERDSKAKAEQDRIRKEESVTAAVSSNTSAGANPAVNGRKASQPVAPAVPPQLLKQTSSTGAPSPHVTPAIPKAPTPNRPRQTSQQGSHGSSPKTPQVAPGTSKSISPSSQLPHAAVPKSILVKSANAQMHMPPNQPLSPMPHQGPMPNLQGPPGFNPPPGLNGFAGQGPIMPSPMPNRSAIPPFFPPQAGSQNFRPFPPPGMHGAGSLQMGPGFPMDRPPGFTAPPGFSGPSHGFGIGMPSHSRQGSGSFERMSNVETPLIAPQAQPIQRPAPIQRPSSVKPQDDGRGSDVDDLADHLGSKALLDDEEDVPEPPERRTSVQQHGSLRGAPPLGFGFGDAGAPNYGSFGAPGGGNIWGTPPLGFATGAPWGTSPTSGLFNNPFTAINPRIERGTDARPAWLRRMVCAACKALQSHSTQDGYIDALEVHEYVNITKNPMEAPVSLEEIKDACDLLQINGGGTLEYKENSGRLQLVRFIDSTAPPPSLGEIGSPVPSHSVLAGGFGRFPGLGPQGF